MSRQRRYKRRSKRSYYIATAPRKQATLEPEETFWSRNRTRFVVLLLGGLLVSVLAFLFMTDTFYVYAPVVQGNVLVPAEEIVRQSGVINQSIFFISASQVEKAVASIPGVKSAKVQTALPSKVVISVQEREPAAVWQSGPSTMWVDSEGVLLPMRSARTDPSGLSPSGRSLPLIIDRDEQPLQANERVDAGAVQAAMVLRGRLPRSKQFDYSRSRGLAFTDSEGRLIVIGTNEEIENKLAILAALSQEIQQKGLAVKFIDLRFTQRPYYR